MLKSKSPTNAETPKNQRAAKTPWWATALVALALISIFYALWRGSLRISVQGPVAIAINADGSSWLAVDRAVWQIDAQGKRIQEFTGPGQHGRASRLILHPSGALWAVIQGDDQIYALQQQSWSPVLRLKWPADLAKDGTRAQTVAVAADGHIAVATSGGHFVALFAPDGRFIAQTEPDTYRYTNGLWFANQSLWTTDTNNGALVRLDLPSLKVAQRLNLNLAKDSRRFLGTVVPWPSGVATANQTVLAALILFDNNMTRGHLAAVDAQGKIQPFDGPSDMQPLDVAWHAPSATWWMVDSTGFQVRRWTAEGKPLAPAFDVELQTQLAQSMKQRQRIDWEYYAGLTIGITLLSLALIALGVKQFREKRKLGFGIQWKLGTPKLSEMALAKLLFKHLAILWPLFALAAVAKLAPKETIRSFVNQALAFAPSVAWLTIIGVYLFVVVIVTVRQARQLSRDPQLESLANLQAIRALFRNPTVLKLAPDELPAEAAWFQQGMTSSLLVLTNRGLIFLKMKGLGRLEQTLSIPWRYVTQFDYKGKLKLNVTAQNGKKLKEWKGHVPHVVLAQRMHAYAKSATLALNADPFDRPRDKATPIDQPSTLVPPIHAGLASALIPGLGQRLQRRKEDALTHFVIAIPLLCLLGFLIYLQSAPRTDVEPIMLVAIAATYAVVLFFSAWDAFSHSKDRQFNSEMNGLAS